MRAKFIFYFAKKPINLRLFLLKKAVFVRNKMPDEQFWRWEGENFIKDLVVPEGGKVGGSEIFFGGKSSFLRKWSWSGMGLIFFVY